MQISWTAQAPSHGHMPLQYQTSPDCNSEARWLWLDSGGALLVGHLSSCAVSYRLNRSSACHSAKRSSSAAGDHDPVFGRSHWGFSRGLIPPICTMGFSRASCRSAWCPSICCTRCETVLVLLSTLIRAPVKKYVNGNLSSLAHRQRCFDS